jgi:cytochrome c-type biogenesis protein CcmH
LALVMVLTIPSLALAKYTYNSKEFKEVINQLDMQGHADHDLATCSVKKVYYEEVIDMLNSGKSGDEIIQSYVDEYGQAALRTPGSDAGGIIAWIMPALGLAFGTFIVIKGIRRLVTKQKQNEAAAFTWESDTDYEIFAKTMDEKRRKFF